MSLGFAHTIKQNANNERPRHLLVFDVESRLSGDDTNKTYFTPFLWTLIYHRFMEATRKATTKKMWGTDINEFWNMVEHYTYDKQKTIISSHHLEPDFIPMQGITILPERGWLLHKYINHNKILIFEFTKDKRKLCVINSGNIFPGSIASWGDSMQIPKLDMPKENADITIWIKYCMRDSEVLLAMWLKYIEFLNLHNLGNMQYTAASQAMTSYRHRFMSKQIAIHHHEQTMILERESYHGGRFQALAIGTPQAKQFWRLDINSMYGDIMRKTSLPYELRGYADNCSYEKLLWLLKKYLVIAEVTVESKEPFFPIIVEDKIKYKSGVHTAVMCTPELEHAIKHGKIIEVKRASWYKHYPIFEQYSNYFLSLRQEYKSKNDIVFERLAKLFVNSLYGKFGQYGYEDKIIDTCDPSIIKYEEGYNIHTHKTISYFYYGGKIHMSTKTGNSYNTFVAIASHITAIGRLQLWSLIKQAGIKNVYHVATDSLIVNANGLHHLQNKIDDNKYGALKIEETFSRLVIKAPNDMMIDEVEKIKGINKKAQKLDDNTYVITQWPKFSTLLKRDELSQYYTRSVIKHLKRGEFVSLDQNGNHVKVKYEY